MPARCFPLYKGATRVPTVGGVPLVPLVVVGISIVCIGILFGVWWLGLLLPAWLLMKQISRADDRAFHILWLWMQTKLRNRLRMIRFSGRNEFWGASTYAPSEWRPGREAKGWWRS